MTGYASAHPENRVKGMRMARTVGSDGSKTEEAIRRAAIDLIAAHGFEAVTLRDLAARVGIQAGSLYRYHASKTDLLASIMIAHMQDLLAHWTAEDVGAEPPQARLDRFIEFHVRYHAGKQREVFIANMEIRSLAPDDRTKVTALRRDYEGRLRAILEDGVAAGEFDIPDVRVATFAIIAMLTGLTAWYQEGGRLSKAQLVACYQSLITKGVDASDIRSDRAVGRTSA
jgi:AcrR family transcriptional regulator